MDNEAITVSELGEKRIISDIVRPMFNSERDPYGVGDDCGVIISDYGCAVLLSTDRVPADLIALKHGLIGYRGFGSHLASLNLSDIAACGGKPIGLLLNCGLPKDFMVADFRELCCGVRDVVGAVGCRVLGGDISSSAELSVSASVVGTAIPSEILFRSGARSGDLVFFSRPVGLTPAAFWLLRTPGAAHDVAKESQAELRNHLLSLLPMVQLGRALAAYGWCTSCMDNTDGLAQTLTELGEASGVGFELESGSVSLPGTVLEVARIRGEDPYDFALGPGHDFSLVGTLQADTPAGVLAELEAFGLQVVGIASERGGVRLRETNGQRELATLGWNYFSKMENV